MLRPEVIRKRLGKLEEYLQILSRIREYDREEFLSDPEHYGSAERFLQLAIESINDDDFARRRHRGHGRPRKSGGCARNRRICKGIEDRALRFPSSKKSTDGLFAISSMIWRRILSPKKISAWSSMLATFPP